MELDKTDLEYIKQTIEWLNEHTVLIDDNRTNCKTIYSSVQNILHALESALAEKPDSSKNTLPIHVVIGRFFKEMAEKHNVEIEALNMHIDGKTLYVQKYQYGAYPEYTPLDDFRLNDL